MFEQPKPHFKAIATILFWAVLMPSLLIAANEPRLILTSKDYAITSDKSFSPFARINGTLVLPAPISGVHKLEAIWTGPQNIQNHFQSSIDFSDQARQTLSVWLDLGSKGGMLSSMRDQDSDNSQYVGRWTVEALLDGRSIIKQSFSVD